MRSCPVLLLFGAAVLGVNGGIVNERDRGSGKLLNREVRQVWVFPDQLGTSRSPFRTSTTPPETTPSTPRPQASGRTTVKPLGVVFQVKDCSCPATPQYNPVCGTDSNTYVNRQVLLCARKCGFAVEEARMGACDSP